MGSVEEGGREGGRDTGVGDVKIKDGMRGGKTNKKRERETVTKRVVEQAHTLSGGTHTA